MIIKPDLKSRLERYWHMIWEMAVMQFRVRDQGSFLGFFWTLLHPLIYFIVLHGLFKKWMGHHISNFPVYLIIGIVQWGFFTMATTNSINAITAGETFIKSINFPKPILVYSSVLTVLFSHVLELFILLIFLLIVGQPIGFKALMLVPILALNVYLAVGVSLMLAVIGVFFLDIKRIWGIFTSVGLFLTPIFYSLELLSPGKRRIILLNPMAHIIQASRDILMDNKFPELNGLLYVFILSSVILFFGYNIFRKYEGYFAEKI